jgi:hypothetical protein
MSIQEVSMADAPGNNARLFAANKEIRLIALFNASPNNIL